MASRHRDLVKNVGTMLKWSCNSRQAMLKLTLFDVLQLILLYIVFVFRSHILMAVKAFLVLKLCGKLQSNLFYIPEII